MACLFEWLGLMRELFGGGVANVVGAGVEGWLTNREVGELHGGGGWAGG